MIRRIARHVLLTGLAATMGVLIIGVGVGVGSMVSGVIEGSGAPAHLSVPVIVGAAFGFLVWVAFLIEVDLWETRR